MLTPTEKHALNLAGELFAYLSLNVVGDGSTRKQDLAEVAFHIHAIQNMVMAQSAARVHPELCRPLGGD